MGGWMDREEDVDVDLDTDEYVCIYSRKLTNNVIHITHLPAIYVGQCFKILMPCPVAPWNHTEPGLCHCYCA